METKCTKTMVLWISLELNFTKDEYHEKIFLPEQMDQCPLTSCAYIGVSKCVEPFSLKTPDLAIGDHSIYGLTHIETVF